MSKKSLLTPYLIFVCVVMAIGGVLFGYHTSVISGALPFLSHDFALHTLEKELVVSLLLIGALVGAFLGGGFADILGRRLTMLLTTIVYLIGTFIIVYAESVGVLISGRIIIGFAIGVSSVVVPLYLAEVSPPKVRGALVSLNQLAITVGILLAYVFDYIFAHDHDWRWMFAIAFFPAAIQFLLLFLIPETPSWLINHGKKEKARETLEKLRRVLKDDEVIVEQQVKTNHKTRSWKRLLDPNIRSAFAIGIGIAVFQQITGINTVIYYAPTIFKLAGFTTGASTILPAIWVGVINVLMTIIALWLIDRLGRRPLLIIGLVGMICSLAVLGWAFHYSSSHVGNISVICLITYVAFFAISLGPVAWLIISEIYPLSVRGRAMGIATFANWTCNFLVSLTFLTLIEYLGTGGAFWFYTVVGMLALWFVFTKVPETKGKSLEQIQKFWRQD